MTAEEFKDRFGVSFENFLDGTGIKQVDLTDEFGTGGSAISDFKAERRPMDDDWVEKVVIFSAEVAKRRLATALRFLDKLNAAKEISETLQATA